MGRASRRKKSRRDRAQTLFGDRYQHRSKKKADRAERFGRTVGSTLADYEAAALRGQRSLAAALISRHNQRMERVGWIQPALLRRTRILMNQLYALHIGLHNVGADQLRPPIHYGASWPDHLGWGVDSIVASVRLLLAGQLVGAAQIARSQLERWAMNLEHNAELQRSPAESTADYYNRLWGAADPTGRYILPEAERNNSGERQLPINGRRASPGALYEEVSKFLHGRGPGIAAVRWEACDLLAATSSGAVLEIGQQILDMLELSVERLRTCICACLAEQDDHQRAKTLFSMSRLNFPAGDAPYPRWGMWPLLPNSTLTPPVMRQLRMAKVLLQGIQGEQSAGRTFTNDEVSVIFYISQRARSAEFAISCFEEEAEMIGGLGMNALSGREFGIIITAELLGLVARWDRREEASAAAAVASSGLRSAFWLWLEDDNRAMGVLRIVLEATARLETWNRKLTKAEKLEARGSLTSPRDWLDAAGWRRLRALNLALSELAHTGVQSRWTGARELLVALQPPGESPELAPHKGRGYALDCIVTLAAKTALGSVELLSPAFKGYLHGLMSNTGVFDDRTDDQLQKWLDRVWDQRTFDLGEAVFKAGPPTEAS